MVEPTVPPEGPRPRQRTPVATPSAPAPADPVETTKTVNLLVPVEIDGVMVDVMTIRRPTLRDRMLVSRLHGKKPNEEQEIIFMANLVGVNPDQLESLDFGDYSRLQGALSDFLRSEE